MNLTDRRTHIQWVNELDRHTCSGWMNLTDRRTHIQWVNELDGQTDTHAVGKWTWRTHMQWVNELDGHTFSGWMNLTDTHSVSGRMDGLTDTLSGWMNLNDTQFLRPHWLGGWIDGWTHTHIHTYACNVCSHANLYVSAWTLWSHHSKFSWTIRIGLESCDISTA